MRIALAHCTVEWTEHGARTTFTDGSTVEGHHHPADPHYAEISHRLGYHGDTLAYAREHDFLHSRTQEQLHGRPSPVLWARAHGGELTGLQSLEEEAVVQLVQRWLRAGERPIIGGIPWDGWKEAARSMLDMMNRAD